MACLDGDIPNQEVDYGDSCSVCQDRTCVGEVVTADGRVVTEDGEDTDIQVEDFFLLVFYNSKTKPFTQQRAIINSCMND